MAEPRPSTSPAWLYEIVGKSSTSDWFSPAPLNDIVPHLDYILAKHCSLSGWGKAATAWLCCLVGQPGLL
eukprot:1343293-Heterocapsa_arctica.AAC.1